MNLCVSRWQLLASCGTMAAIAVLIGGCPPGTGDLCAGVTCEAGFTCNAGTGTCEATPVDLCAGVTCDDGSECDAATGDCVATGEPTEFTDADATRGGGLYDKWWAIAELDEPTGDHAFWATRPDMDSNTRTGLDTWRCKECHGWDYRGVDGAYGGGSHKTGFGGIAGTTLTAQEVFDELKTDHGFGDAGLTDADIWDLAKFVLQGVIDTSEIIDADNAFIGDADAGQTLYDDGIRSNLACAVCHGADGLAINFKEPPDEEFLGDLARGNPWEFQHKVRFGQPGAAMPVGMDVDATNDEVAAVGAYTQTLGVEAGPEGDAKRGGGMYDKWWVVAEVDEPTGDHAFWATRPDMDSNTRTGLDTWRCKECHGWDYKGKDGAYADGSSHATGFDGIAGTTMTAQEIFDELKTNHGFGDAGLTDEDIQDLAKFVLEGVIDTDEIIDADKAFIGDVDAGQTLYDDGIRSNLACAVCHGADGLAINFKEPPDEEFLGDLARGNPWEFQHKVRFGQPGAAMPVGLDVDATNDEVAAVGAYTQTLAVEP